MSNKNIIAYIGPQKNIEVEIKFFDYKYTVQNIRKISETTVSDVDIEFVLNILKEYPYILEEMFLTNEEFFYLDQHLELNPNLEMFQPLWELFGNFNLAISVPGWPSFRSEVKEKLPDYNLQKAMRWYKEVTLT